MAMNGCFGVSFRTTHPQIENPVFSILKSVKCFISDVKSQGNLIECILTRAQLVLTTQRVQSGIIEVSITITIHSCMSQIRTHRRRPLVAILNKTLVSAPTFLAPSSLSMMEVRTQRESLSFRSVSQCGRNWQQFVT